VELISAGDFLCPKTGGGSVTTQLRTTPMWSKIRLAR